MRFASFRRNGETGMALLSGGIWRGLSGTRNGTPWTLDAWIADLAGAARHLRDAPEIDLSQVELLPPLGQASKIVCVGLNFHDHSAESGHKQPDFPTIFGRFTSSLVADGAPILRPLESEQLDYEGELVAVIGRTARNVAKADALSYVAGYSIFNDASIRDFQMRTPQWTAGKNFDGTGAFGPHLVTADELPPGCEGLMLRTRLNGRIVQEASISDMVFPVADLVSILSGFMTLTPGDVIVAGTPAGVGLGRKPPLWMKDGDVCEVEIEGIGTLRNPIRDAAPVLGKVV